MNENPRKNEDQGYHTPPVFSGFPPCPEVGCSGTLIPLSKVVSGGGSGLVCNVFNVWRCTVCAHKIP